MDAILCTAVARQRRPTLYAMQSFGRRRRPRALPNVRPLPAILVGLASALLATAGFVGYRLWPLTDRAAGAIPASASQPAVQPGNGPAPPHAGLFVGAPVGGRPHGVHARAAIVVDRVTGRVLWSHAPHRRLAIASLTKLMTAAVALDRAGHLDRPFRVTAAMTGAPGYTIGLHPGQVVTERRMLAAALIESANDAADALAVHRAGSIGRFVRLMNARAASLGLEDTRYSNPSGIVDAHNRSSAWDIAALSLRVLRQPLVRALVARKTFATGPTTSYVSRNRLLWTYPGAIGIKTGQTTVAGNCIAAAAQHGSRSVVAVLLHVRGDEFAAAARLLTWGFRHDR